MIDYVTQFLNNYKGLNKFAFVQSLAGHEDTGTIIATLDQDLPEQIDQILNTDDDIVLFLMADHGMRYGEWFNRIEGSHEHKLPAMFTIVSKSIMDNIEGSYDTMQFNTNRLVSKLDIYRTLRHMSLYPYKQDYSRLSSEYRGWNRETGTNPVSLFLEKIPNTRSCDDINIPPYFCACLKYYDVTPE